MVIWEVFFNHGLHGLLRITRGDSLCVGLCLCDCGCLDGVFLRHELARILARITRMSGLESIFLTEGNGGNGEGILDYGF